MKNHNPILDPELMQQVEAAIIMYKKRAQWRDWGLSQLRDQGSAILFYGPTGTGKTITARWIARQLHQQLEEIEFAQVGSDKPGELARNLGRWFDHAKLPDKNGKEAIVFLDECDTMLLARKNLGRSHMWLIEVINKLLVEIRKFPGLVILATNMEPLLDDALESRILKKLHFTAPTLKETKIALWKQKWPRKLPTQPTQEFLDWVSEYNLTGSDVETAIINWASKALYEDKIPNLAEFKFDNNPYGERESSTQPLNTQTQEAEEAEAELTAVNPTPNRLDAAEVILYDGVLGETTAIPGEDYGPKST